MKERILFVLIGLLVLGLMYVEIEWNVITGNMRSSRSSNGIRNEMGVMVIMRPGDLRDIDDDIHHVWSGGSVEEDAMCENMMDPIILIGTDGSGTRVPTRALSKMGVSILVDPDVAHQMDIDGSEVGLHFTKLIRDLLCITGGPNYKLENLPKEIQKRILSSVRPWILFIRAQACKIAKKRKSLETFRFGFKKPDLIYFIPVLRHFWPNAKFVHIIRDGRDMALSKNEAVYQKYAASMFGEGCDRPKNDDDDDSMTLNDFMNLSKAARMAYLWSRSNVGVQNLFSGSEFEDSRHVVRVEDLNAQDDRSVDSYTALARFARLNDVGICMVCEIRAQIQSTFMGSFDATLEQKSGKTKNAAFLNYGKWKPLANTDPDLLSSIDVAAREGLQVYHYYKNPTSSPSSLNVCSRIKCRKLDE